MHYYDECNPLDSTLQHFRNVYGGRRYLMGDLGFRNTRKFYHYVLGTSLANVDCKINIPLEQRAKMAFYTRKAAKVYTRERSLIFAKILCDLYDGLRHFIHHGTWSGDGLSWEEVYEKYEKLLEEQMPSLTTAELKPQVFDKIVQKSHQTNPHFDQILLSDDPVQVLLTYASTLFQVPRLKIVCCTK